VGDAPDQKSYFSKTNPRLMNCLFFFGGGSGQRPKPGALNPSIIISYQTPDLHFKNFTRKLRLLAMLSSFTGRIITTIPVVLPVVSITVVVSVPV